MNNTVIDKTGVIVVQKIEKRQCDAFVRHILHYPATPVSEEDAYKRLAYHFYHREFLNHDSYKQLVDHINAMVKWFINIDGIAYVAEYNSRNAVEIDVKTFVSHQAAYERLLYKSNTNGTTG